MLPIFLGALNHLEKQRFDLMNTLNVKNKKTKTKQNKNNNNKKQRHLGWQEWDYFFY